MSYHILRCYIAIIACSLLVLFAGLMLIFRGWLPSVRKLIIKHEKKAVVLVLALGFLGYVISVLGYLGVEKFVRDFDVFLMWSRMMLDDGIKGFMTEYPPFGMYLLALSQGFLRITGLVDKFLIATVVMKLPAIISTLVLSYISYRWARKQNPDSTRPIFIMMLIAFNPAFLINASMWG